jgi:hypothetical protein
LRSSERRKGQDQRLLDPAVPLLIIDENLFDR